MHLTFLQQCLWLAPTCVEVILVAGMTYRGLWRDLPFFFSYLVLTIVRTCFLFSLRNDATRYFLVFWFSAPIGDVSELFVIKELFDHVFDERLDLRRTGRVLFRWSLAGLLLLAALFAWNSPGGDTKKLMLGIWAIKRTIVLVETGLLFLLGVFMATIGLPLLNSYLGIFIGLTSYGMVEFVTSVVRAALGTTDTTISNWIKGIADVFRVLGWAFYILPRTLPETAISNRQLDKLGAALDEMRSLLVPWKR